MFSILDAEYFVTQCQKMGILIERIELDSGLLTLVKTFQAGNMAEYVKAESDTSIIFDVPYVKGNSSTWGTTGDGIGGFVGCKNGVMRINRSSCKKTFLKAVKKLIDNQKE